MGHYDVLGVGPDASAAEVRRAYLALARRHHPDREGGSLERMRMVNEAWATLGDPERRRRYDLAQGGPTPPTAPWASAAWAAEDAETAAWTTLRDDLLDDRPIHGGMVRLPRWVALLPPALFVGALVTGLIGLVVGLPAVLGFAFLLGTLSAMFFLASPFIALAASRRRTG